jgi:hypothetical protein
MSLEKVQELLKKQRRVQGVVHGQNMPKHDMWETLVQRQHSAELSKLVA